MKRPLNKNPSSSGGEIELEKMTTEETSIGDDARGGETMSYPRGVEFLTALSGGEARSNNFSTDDFPPIIRFTLRKFGCTRRILANPRHLTSAPQLN